MTLGRLIVREIGHRKLNFLFGVIAVGVAVACLVTALSALRAHDRRSEQIIAAREAETREKMAALEDDYRKITLRMGFNVLILPKDQNLSDLYADDFASKYMPEEYAARLVKSRVATINHVLPSLQQKVKWPEQQRTIILMGVRGEVYLQNAKQKPLLAPVAAGTMVVGAELHRSLHLKVGDKVKLLGREFTVAKLYDERGNKDDITIWINLGEAQELLNKPGLINAILALDCTCDTVDRLSRIRPEITRILPDTQVIEYASQAIARAETRTRASDAAQAALEREKQNRAKLRRERESFGAVLVPLVTLGSAIWIGLLALANVRERRTEIGILRALGVGTPQILAVFLGKAIVIGLVGAALGYPAGLLTGAPAVDSRMLPAVLAGAPVLAALASWLPALLAAQQDPADVLREE